MEKYKVFHLVRVFIALRSYLIENHHAVEADFSRYNALNYDPLHLTGQEKNEVMEALWAIVRDLNEEIDQIDQHSQSEPDPQQSGSEPNQDPIKT